MKILFLTRRFYPHVGGVEKHIWKISSELVREGHTVSIIAENHDPSKVQDGWTKEKNLPVYFVDFGKESTWKKFRIWAWMIAHVRLFLEADVIHTHDVMFWYYPLRCLLFWKPVCATFHGDEKVYPPVQSAVLMRRISAFLASGSINVGSYLEKWYGTKATITIWGAVDRNKLNFEVHNPLRILLVGRLDPDISIKKYCAILTQLHKQHMPCTFEVCGDGKLRSSISAFGKVHGFVDDVNPYISQADVVFCSSYLAILEALSHGKRVVAVYDHPMKKDYLEMSPFAKWICITDSVEKAARYIATKGKTTFSLSEKKDIEIYIQSISWKAITHQYVQLWKK